MNEWGGAQWMIVFLVAIRTILGMGKLTGAIVLPDAAHSKSGSVGEYIGRRLMDAALIGILIWGDFF